MMSQQPPVWNNLSEPRKVDLELIQTNNPACIPKRTPRISLPVSSSLSLSKHWAFGAASVLQVH